MKKRFTVAIREIHVSHRDVEANDYSDAVKQAMDGNYDNEYLEYSHTPDDSQIDIHDTETGDILVKDFSNSEHNKDS